MDDDEPERTIEERTKQNAIGKGRFFDKKRLMRVVSYSSKRKVLGAGFCGKIPGIPALKPVA